MNGNERQPTTTEDKDTSFIRTTQLSRLITIRGLSCVCISSIIRIGTFRTNSCLQNGKTFSELRHECMNCNVQVFSDML